MRGRAAWWLATWFGCGYFPIAPGTVASAVAIGIAWLLAQAGFGNLHFLVIAFALLYPAISVAGVVAAQLGKKDPGLIVVDEVAGQWLTLAGGLRFEWRTFVFAFLLFRFFDILKPPPIRLVERVPGGSGIVLDDMMAGAYGALVLFIMGWFTLY
jgi:phosphatidylglycerophosphatase A